MAPFRQRTIYEVNAELSFYQLNDDMPMHWAKHSEKGIEERESSVEAKVPGVLRIIEAEVPGTSICPPARRCRHPLDGAKDLCQGRGPHPQDPEWDEQGLRMEIVR